MEREREMGSPFPQPKCQMLLLGRHSRVNVYRLLLQLDLEEAVTESANGQQKNHAILGRS
jgi:hypothetical protein